MCLYCTQAKQQKLINHTVSSFGPRQKSKADNDGEKIVDTIVPRDH